MFKTGDLARRWHVSDTTVRGFIEKGWLKCTRTPTNRYYYTEEDVKEFEEKYMKRMNEGGMSDAVQKGDNANDGNES